MFMFSCSSANIYIKAIEQPAQALAPLELHYQGASIISDAGSTGKIRTHDL